MATPSVFDKVKSDKNYNATNSMTWFRGKVAALTNSAYQPAPLLTARRASLHNLPTPGQFCLFNYDPKGKDTLPFYDRYPLVLPFRIKGQSMFGLNMHYLHPNTRAILVDRLMVFKNDKDRFIFTWNMVKGASKFPGVQKAIKQYLLPHAKTRFLPIPLEDMPIALFLPMESFVGARKSEIWRR